jgi:hypothetical protein
MDNFSRDNADVRLGVRTAQQSRASRRDRSESRGIRIIPRRYDLNLSALQRPCLRTRQATPPLLADPSSTPSPATDVRQMMFFTSVQQPARAAIRLIEVTVRRWDTRRPRSRRGRPGPHALRRLPASLVRRSDPFALILTTEILVRCFHITWY